LLAFAVVAHAETPFAGGAGGPGYGGPAYGPGYGNPGMGGPGIGGPGFGPGGGAPIVAMPFPPNLIVNPMMVADFESLIRHSNAILAEHDILYAGGFLVDDFRPNFVYPWEAPYYQSLRQATVAVRFPVSALDVSVMEALNSFRRNTTYLMDFFAKLQAAKRNLSPALSQATLPVIHKAYIDQVVRTQLSFNCAAQALMFELELLRRKYYCAGAPAFISNDYREQRERFSQKVAVMTRMMYWMAMTMVNIERSTAYGFTISTPFYPAVVATYLQNYNPLSMQPQGFLPPPANAAQYFEKQGWPMPSENFQGENQNFQGQISDMYLRGSQYQVDAPGLPGPDQGGRLERAPENVTRGQYEQFMQEQERYNQTRRDGQREVQPNVPLVPDDSSGPILRVPVEPQYGVPPAPMGETYGPPLQRR